MVRPTTMIVWAMIFIMGSSSVMDAVAERNGGCTRCNRFSPAIIAQEWGTYISDDVSRTLHRVVHDLADRGVACLVLIPSGMQLPVESHPHINVAAFSKVDGRLIVHAENSSITHVFGFENVTGPDARDLAGTLGVPFHLVICTSPWRKGPFIDLDAGNFTVANTELAHTAARVWNYGTGIDAFMLMGLNRTLELWPTFPTVRVVGSNRVIAGDGAEKGGPVKLNVLFHGQTGREVDPKGVNVALLAVELAQRNLSASAHAGEHEPVQLTLRIRGPHTVDAASADNLYEDATRMLGSEGMAVDGRRTMNVDLQPFTDAPGLTRDLEWAHVLLLPSNSEPFGLVGYEAIARGVSTIMPRVSGLVELVGTALEEGDVRLSTVGRLRQQYVTVVLGDMRHRVQEFTDMLVRESLRLLKEPHLVEMDMAILRKAVQKYMAGKGAKKGIDQLIDMCSVGAASTRTL